eukprot:CAMPEP_0172307816 /NCGR_PEP_ID=MMETSP1058-20130122/8591_1 /TAXON_ID=83371 /ORGANISM="Detonula confervacea, Strain CCMP 353" /LENGTH=699 /DNA_ID=CAMNT_0013020091 /DNA_START=114 /DNA_END=2213 /DNA_ORIENTATION=+
MPSSKKKNRNKRSGKNTCANTSKGKFVQRNPDEKLMEQCFEKKFKHVPPEDIVARVRQGEGKPTQLLSEFLRYWDNDIVNQYLQRLVDAGLIPAVLEILSRCEDDDFCDVVEADATACSVVNSQVFNSRNIEGQEGTIPEPRAWVLLLHDTVQHVKRLGEKRNHECRMQIAQEIAPLVKCMCDDMRRELFRSTKYWHTCIFPFIALIFNLAGTKETQSILIEHDGFLALMVQCIFWSDQRPDILKESQPFMDGLKPHSLSSIASLAFGVIGYILEGHQQEDEFKYFFDGVGKECNINIGATSIVSKAYDPDSKKVFVSCLIGLLKGSKNAVMASENLGIPQEEIRKMLYVLMVTGCVDKNVIAEVVDFGLSHTTTYDDALWVAKMSYRMTSAFPPAGQQTYPRDSPFAAAIDDGLLEMFLELLSRFGHHRDESEQLLTVMDMTLQACNGVVLHKKTSKAIRLRSQQILDVPLQLTESESPSVNDRCKRIVQNIYSLVRMSGASQPMKKSVTVRSCTYCMKILARSEVNFCGICNIVTYCSKECQAKDWKGGHKKTCTKSNGKSSEALLEKICVILDRFIDENRSTILTEATLKGYNILDCLVFLDLRKLPATVEVMLLKDFSGYKQCKISSILDLQSGEVVLLLSLTSGNATNINPYCGNWTDEQSAVKRKMQGEVDLLKDDLELREKALMKVKKNYIL